MLRFTIEEWCKYNIFINLILGYLLDFTINQIKKVVKCNKKLCSTLNFHRQIMFSFLDRLLFTVVMANYFKMVSIEYKVSVSSKKPMIL